MGWGHKVVGHMPWGALSGSPRVRGHEKVFWGLCGCFHAPVVQYLQYMQILIRYVRIHTDTYKYLHIHTYWRQQNTYGGNILKDTNRFLLIHTDTCIYLLQKKIPTPRKIYPHILSYTYIYLPNTYKKIPTDSRLTLNVFACICRYLVGIKEVFRRYSEVFDQYFAVL